MGGDESLMDSGLARGGQGLPATPCPPVAKPLQNWRTPTHAPKPTILIDLFVYLLFPVVSTDEEIKEGFSANINERRITAKMHQMISMLPGQTSYNT